MSDDRLRELERRWRSTGADSDEGLYLLERVRVADLTPERVAIAAYFGHRGAREAIASLPPQPVLQGAHACDYWLRLREEGAKIFAVEEELPFLQDKEYPPGAPAGISAFVGWTSFLLQFPLEVQVRAAVAGAREVLPVWEGFVGSNVLRNAVQETEHWVACPCERHLTKSLELLEAAREAEDAPYEISESQSASLSVWANSAVSNLAPLLTGQPSERGEPALEAVLRYAAFALAHGPMPEEQGAPAPNLVAVLSALKRDLVAWSLGHGTSVTCT